jgi:hypothetical protein
MLSCSFILSYFYPSPSQLHSGRPLVKITLPRILLEKNSEILNKSKSSTLSKTGSQSVLPSQSSHWRHALTTRSSALEPALIQPSYLLIQICQDIVRFSGTAAQCLLIFRCNLKEAFAYMPQIRCKHSVGFSHLSRRLRRPHFRARTQTHARATSCQSRQSHVSPEV